MRFAVGPRLSWRAPPHRTPFARWAGDCDARDPSDWDRGDGEGSTGSPRRRRRRERSAGRRGVWTTRGSRGTWGWSGGGLNYPAREERVCDGAFSCFDKDLPRRSPALPITFSRPSDRIVPSPTTTPRSPGTQDSARLPSAHGHRRCIGRQCTGNAETPPDAT